MDGTANKIIRVGTSGYSYPDWVGPFYPRGTPSRYFLEYYARKFDSVEINNTYYRLQGERYFSGIADRTPVDFLFTVKVNRKITHERDATVRQVVSDFKKSLQPLVEAEKLGALLLQFPWSFKPVQANISFLEFLGEEFNGYKPIVEFRNEKWLEEGLFPFLGNLGIGLCAVDEPELKGLLPPLARATANSGYIRFHGRNAAKWWKHEKPHERYDYLYTHEELSEWLPRIKKLLEHVETLFIFTNNHYQGNAVKNALMLKEMLGIENGSIEAEPDQGSLF